MSFSKIKAQIIKKLYHLRIKHSTGPAFDAVVTAATYLSIKKQNRAFNETEEIAAMVRHYEKITTVFDEQDLNLINEIGLMIIEAVDLHVGDILGDLYMALF